MTDTHHTLTEHERKLLEDLGADKVRHELSSTATHLNVWQHRVSSVAYAESRFVKSGAYIPRPAVEAWLAEQDEREAEIERRINLLVDCEIQTKSFDISEQDYDILHLDKDGFPWRTYDLYPDTIPVPTARIRQAIDAHRAKQADHFRDAAEKVEADDVGEGPWEVRDEGNAVMLRKHGNNLHYAASFWYYTSQGQGSVYPSAGEAMIAALAEANRLNAKLREERDAREAAEVKARRVAAFVGREDQHRFIRLFKEWGHGNWAVWDDGLLTWGQNPDPSSNRSYVTEQELLSTLASAGITPPVEIDPELRRRLWLYLAWCVKVGRRFIPMFGDERVFLDKDGLDSSSKEEDVLSCTRAQAEAFLAEIRRMGEAT